MVVDVLTSSDLKVREVSRTVPETFKNRYVTSDYSFRPTRRVYVFVTSVSLRPLLMEVTKIVQNRLIQHSD